MSIRFGKRRKCERFFLVCFVFFVFCFGWISTQDFSCCTHASGSCKSVCEKISLVHVAADKKIRNETIAEVEDFCSHHTTLFWECFEATLKDISRGDSWSGRQCCTLPQSESCQRACITATSDSELKNGCRQSDEITFFSCLERQHQGERCCSKARDKDCKEACMDIFKSSLTPNKVQRQQVKDNCDSSSGVLQCVKDFVKVTPVENTNTQIHCCEKTNNAKCREACKHILSTQTSLQEIVDGLSVGGCGYPLPQDYFWQCFFKPDVESVTSVEISRIDRVGMDSAKWHCCSRAKTSQCNRLCSKTFTKMLATSWTEFNLKCLSQPVEEELRNCLDEVDEPCELGCDGLSFCTNFNNRPTELFRSCNIQVDEAARADVTLWQNEKNLTLPGLKLPLKSNPECSPDIWKAVACTLQIKPCARFAHGNQICREDCWNVLTECIDWTRVPTSISADTICEGLSSSDPSASCIRLENYLNPSEYNFQRVSGQISSPCRGNPCEKNEICMVSKNTNTNSNNYQPYNCVPGCKLGEVSDYMVPDGTYVRIPIPNNPKGCLKICKCSNHQINQCQPLPCVTLTACQMGQYTHGSSFNVECNVCSCYAGETICSKKQCEGGALSGTNTGYTTLPCNCPPHYIPVCGRNGITYPSDCLAKCAGLTDSDIERNSCQNPCKLYTCPIGQKCVPKPQICLSLKHKPCIQYECVNGTANCFSLPKDPVCDIDNKEYYNACHLAHDNAKLAYRGPCLLRCKYKGQVCGINGQTYISECAAIADLILIDYEGPCHAVGLITDTKSRQCANVKCQKLMDINCMGITPPGACCPVCGGSLQILYSRQQIDRALYALQNRTQEALNLKAVLTALERQIQLAQCVLRGFISIELDLFVIVQTTAQYPSLLQLEACVMEAEKIANLINNQSPRIASELSLSSLTHATVVHTQVTGSGTNTINKVENNILIILAVIYLCMYG